MTHAVEIRPADTSDGAAISRLILGIQQVEFGIPITLEDQPDLSNIDGFYRKGAGEFWVAASAQQTIGTIALIDIGAKQGALRKMFVDKAARGPESGVARRLLDTLLDHARHKGLTAVFLGTTAEFHAAHRFYEKSGFRGIAADELPESFPRMAVDTRFYRIDL